jgi:protein-tyrosine-phosphatase
MAEAILRNKPIEAIEVRSAGIYAANGSEASAHAQKVLDDNGITHNHRSSLLTRAEVEWADLILTMTSSHKMAILQQHPHVGQKVFTLKEFSGEGFQSDVVDPYGGSLAMYEQTFRELDELIDKVIGKLKE